MAITFTVTRFGPISTMGMSAWPPDSPSRSWSKAPALHIPGEGGELKDSGLSEESLNIIRKKLGKELRS